MAQHYIFECHQTPPHFFYSEAKTRDETKSCVICDTDAGIKRVESTGPFLISRFALEDIENAVGKVEDLTLENSRLLGELQPSTGGTISRKDVRDVLSAQGFVPSSGSEKQEKPSSTSSQSDAWPESPPVEAPVVETPSAPPLAKSVLLGIGGGGAAALLIASASDGDKIGQRNEGETPFLPSDLKPIIYDLSQEFSEENVKGEIKRYFPMDLNDGSGRFPVFAQMPAEFAYQDFHQRFLQDETDAQLLTMVHSVGGGTGSGTAPVFAKKLGEMGSNDQHAIDFMVSLSIVGTERPGQEKENHVYNLPRICKSFDLAIQIENTMCTGAGLHDYDDFIDHKARHSTAKRYLEGSIRHSLVEKRTPSWFTQINEELLTVPDRYLARIWRLLHGTTYGRNIKDAVGTLENGPRYRHPDGHGRHAVPYIWPIEKDTENISDSSDPTKCVVRALKDGGLARVNIADFQSAESAVIVYNTGSVMDSSFEQKMTRVAARLLNIPESRVVPIRSFLQSDKGGDNVQSVSEMELLILAVGQIPTYVRELHSELKSDSIFRAEIENLGRKWSDYEAGLNPSNRTRRWANLETIASNWFVNAGVGERMREWSQEVYDMDITGPFIDFCKTNNIQ